VANFTPSSTFCQVSMSKHPGNQHVSRENGGSSTRPGDEFVEAFARGLMVIRAFGSAQDSLSMAEVADRTGLTRAGVRRLLYTLVKLGYARVSNGRFSLSPRILDLGFSYLSSLTARGVAQPVIAGLAREVNELCTMSVLDGREIVYIIRVEIRTPLTRSLGVGSRLPAFATSMGRVLLAGESDETIKEFLLSQDLRRITRYTNTDPQQLAKEIRKVRRDGWSLVKEELELGVCGLSAPVRDAHGRVVAAASISFNMARFDERQAMHSFLPKLLGVAEEISLGIRSMPGDFAV
jgi:IclR family transcriptional regulator, pca regulon regulatory protein